MKIAGNSKFNLYIYAKDHPPPHCHVRYSNGEDVSVDIPTIEPRFGATISAEVFTEIEKYLDDLCNAWDQLNPKKEPKK